MHLIKTWILRRLRFAFPSPNSTALLARTRTTQRFTFAFVLLLSSFCGHLFGQASATGAVNGTVTDPSGQVVPGAKVVLLAESTNISTTVTTNGEGQYRIQNVLPSLYSMTVQGAGFRAAQVAPFRINV